MRYFHSPERAELSANPFEAVMPYLEAEGIRVISVDDRFVACPGRDLHTAQSDISDCKVYLNHYEGAIVPRLHCFHQSCRALVDYHNRRLCAGALKKGAASPSGQLKRQELSACDLSSPSACDEVALADVLKNYPWTYQDIINDPRGFVDEPPELHHIYMLSLYDEGDLLWIADDVTASGFEWHYCRFRTVNEWFAEGHCPGAFICPNTFRPGVCSRSGANVARRKFMVVESDTLNRDEVGSVFRWLEAQGLILRAVVDTAGKSLHGWFNYPDPSTIPELRRQLVALKCDPSMFQPSQPCRLPGALRDGHYQRLIHFRYEPQSNLTNDQTQSAMNANNVNTEVIVEAELPSSAPASQPTVSPANSPVTQPPVAPPPVVAPSAANPKKGQGGKPTFSKRLYYDQNLGQYVMKMPKGNWVRLCRSDAFMHVAMEVGQDMAPSILVRVQQDNSVDFSGPLGGYSEGLIVQGDKRILVTSSPKFIQPKPGNWDMLRGILERMFGPEQLTYLFGWIKVALEMFKNQKWMAGQVLILCGEAESGKNLLGFLMQHLFGGRAPGKPFSYMTQKSDFNSEFMGCELLTIEDEVSHAGIQERRAFGAKIKDFAVNESRRLHKKHAEAMTVVPLQRLLMSMNCEPNNLLVLPPIESDNADKIMLLKVFKHDMPRPTNTSEERKAFGNELVSQLPAFVDFLNSWRIPDELVASRYGVKHYHNPELLSELNHFSPEAQLLRLIDEVLFTPFQKTWHGRSVELDRKLKSASSEHVRREAAKLLPAGNSCGKYLSNLANRHPDRVTKHAGRSNTRTWTIIAPESCEDEDEAPQCLHSSRPKVSPELIAKIKGLGAKSTSSVGEADGAGTMDVPEGTTQEIAKEKWEDWQLLLAPPGCSPAAILAPDVIEPGHEAGDSVA